MGFLKIRFRSFLTKTMNNFCFFATFLPFQRRFSVLSLQTSNIHIYSNTAFYRVVFILMESLLTQHQITIVRQSGRQFAQSFRWSCVSQAPGHTLIHPSFDLDTDYNVISAESNTSSIWLSCYMCLGPKRRRPDVLFVETLKLNLEDLLAERS